MTDPTDPATMRDGDSAPDEPVTLAAFLAARLGEDEAAAKAASGGTVVGEIGNWRPSPAGDEWEAHCSADGDEELLVALRPGLPRPPDVMGGYWGAVVSYEPDFADRHASSPMPQFRHIALHDPSRVLREVEAKRRLLRLADSACPDDCLDHGPEMHATEEHWGAAIRSALAAIWSDHPDYSAIRNLPSMR